MKKIAMKAVVVLSGTMVALAGAGAANASPSTDVFLADMHANGFGNSMYGDQGLITAATSACIQMDAGVPWYTVANRIWLTSSLDAVGAQQFVELAAKDFCPVHFGGDTTGTGTASLY